MTPAPRKTGRGWLFVWKVFNVPHPYAKDWDPFGLGNPIHVLKYIYLYLRCFQKKNNFCHPFKIDCAVHPEWQGFLLLAQSSPCKLMLYFFPEKNKIFTLNLAFQ